MNKRGQALYIKDILDAVNNIENYTRRIPFKKFSNDQKTIDAVVRNFEIIGEASKNLSKMTKSSSPEIPWEDVIGMRNKIIHKYFGVDLEIIWKTIQEDLPALKKAVKKLKAKIR